MPILMVAVLALVAFGAIGILLATAVILEQVSKKRRGSGMPAGAVSGQKRVV